MAEAAAPEEKATATATEARAEAAAREVAARAEAKEAAAGVAARGVGRAATWVAEGRTSGRRRGSRHRRAPAVLSHR